MGWAGFNLISSLAVDPYPFTFLNFILSASAAISAPVILMSQNTDRRCELRSIANDQEKQLQQFSELLESLEKLTAPSTDIIQETKKLRALMGRVRPLNRVTDEDHTRGFTEYLTKGLGKFFGSWTFLGGMTGTICCWVAGNLFFAQLGFNPIDPAPYLFLNLALSLISAFTAPVVVMSQTYEDGPIRERAKIFRELAEQRGALQKLVLTELTTVDRHTATST